MEEMGSHTGKRNLSATTHSTGQKRRKIFDWLQFPDFETLTPFQRFVIELDWNNSPLGPISTWPSQLREMVLLVMADPTPAVVYWGDEATIVYNEPYIELIGSKHPALQGQDPKIGFAEIWDHFAALLSRQRDTGKTTLESNALLLLNRSGFLEETYFTWKFSPIIGPEGWVVGSHATVVEVTDQVISERRNKTVRSLSRYLSESSSIEQLWSGIISGLKDSPIDIPLALLYSIADSHEASWSNPNLSHTEVSDSVICVLEGCIGIPRGHQFAAERIKLFGQEQDDSVLSNHLRTALKEVSPVVSNISEKSQDILRTLDWHEKGVPPTTVVVCPIVPSNSDKVLAYLVIALNPRRPYDDDYKSFIHLLAHQVTTPQLSAVILREEVERRAQLAREEATHRERLSRQLSESETKFARFATRAPIGLAVLTPMGLALSANDLWKEYTQLQLGSSKVDWENVFCPGESALVNTAWEEMITTKKSVTIHTRVNGRWQAPDPDPLGNPQWTETFLLVSMYPDLDDENGEISTVMSCITDISGLKWSESQLRRRMDQAIEHKKQQERFIDMTSHEMRNPLSALIGCADEITTSLNTYRNAIQTQKDQPLTKTRINQNSTTPLQPPNHLLDESIEAADTIIYCAMHQKRIIDDILTLSRLDSNLLTISPEPSEPISLVRSALKMFDAESKRASIALRLIEDTSLADLAVKWTLLDPSRVLQVLINLLTNAIKFTRSEQRRREITIHISASLDRPSITNEFGVEYVSKQPNSPDQTLQPEWGTGDVLYLAITVVDTGRGLTEPETKNLFHLFAQASPKTYTKYGGSGLGLFISRQLVEMQGGEIGVGSVSGKGSTFQFYVRTRRAEKPEGVGEDVDVGIGVGVGEGEGDRGMAGLDFQLLAREDALREACADDISVLQEEGLVHTNNPDPDVSLRRKLHILVVEDNLVNQKVVAKQLRNEGHIVSVANHGGEALEFIRRSEFWHSASPASSVSPTSASSTSSPTSTTAPSENQDKNIDPNTNTNTNTNSTRAKQEKHPLSVILLDLEMPIMDGITCVKQIRALQARGQIEGHVPVIAVTANARSDQVLRSLDAGMDDVTTKPYRIKDMLVQIERLVSKQIPSKT